MGRILKNELSTLRVKVQGFLVFFRLQGFLLFFRVQGFLLFFRDSGFLVFFTVFYGLRFFSVFQCFLGFRFFFVFFSVFQGLGFFRFLQRLGFKTAEAPSLLTQLVVSLSPPTLSVLCLRHFPFCKTRNRGCSRFQQAVGSLCLPQFQS